MTPSKVGPFFCSWSGGKDCCLALYHAIRNGGTAKALMTMFTEEGEYHTVVTNGPLFSSPIRLKSKGHVVRNGYCFLDVEAV